jgi:hypothetical protein
MIEFLIIIFCILSGLLNSTEDLLKDKYYESIFINFKHSWFAIDSWKNKYINRDPALGRIYYNVLGHRVRKPVQFTDWWHFSKMSHLILLFLSMFLCTYLEFNFKNFILIFISGCLRNISFSIGYNKLFLLK